MYAIIDEAGKQFKVTSGDTILIDRTGSPDEKTITFDRVLFVGGEGQPKIGAPTIEGASVTADVLGPAKGLSQAHRPPAEVFAGADHGDSGLISSVDYGIASTCALTAASSALKSSPKHAAKSLSQSTFSIRSIVVRYAATCAGCLFHK